MTASSSGGDTEREEGGPVSLEDFALDELLDPVNSNQCEAFADSTGDRCERDAMTPFPYCELHIDDLLDEVDLERIGLKPSNSGV